MKFMWNPVSIVTDIFWGAANLTQRLLESGSLFKERCITDLQFGKSKFFRSWLHGSR
jgi:hypothetical protein